jgi:hypothetical protein
MGQVVVSEFISTERSASGADRRSRAPGDRDGIVLSGVPDQLAEFLYPLGWLCVAPPKNSR